MSREIVIPPAVQVVIETNASQGPAGPPGASGSGIIDLPFSYGDASPSVVVTMIGTVLTVSLAITTPFDGAGAQVSVGTIGSPELLMPVSENYPDVEARYESSPGEFVSGDVHLFITPGAGASAGAGIVYLEVAN